jgi:U3 small nucleolar RNA-associated protein 12
MKRAKEKKQQVEESVLHRQGDEKNEHDAEGDITLVDRFTPYLVIRTSGKIRSFDFGPGDGGIKGSTQVQ